MSVAKLERQRRDWEELAEFNPEWAVLSEPEARFAGWDLDEFFRRGGEQIERTMAVASELGVPRRLGSVLDFGCGVGRLSRELGGRFESYVGVDISAGMVERARALNDKFGNCEFLVNDRPDLSRFGDGEFDAVVSFIVLQHMPDRDLIRRYLGEFARVLAPGGLIAFQLPSEMPLIYRVLWRKRLYRVARALGMSVERAHRLRARQHDDAGAPGGGHASHARGGGLRGAPGGQRACDARRHPDPRQRQQRLLRDQGYERRGR